MLTQPLRLWACRFCLTCKHFNSPASLRSLVLKSAIDLSIPLPPSPPPPQARILYVDPATKTVGLSLLPHLQALQLPSPTPMLGQLFEGAKVRGVYPGLGLLLELSLPSADDEEDVK